jgi:hypothetical protein
VKQLQRGAVPFALYLVAIAGLAAAFVALERVTGGRSPLALAGITGIEVAAIVVAVAFATLECRRRP